MVYKSFPMRRGSLQPLFESQRGSEIDILRQVKWMYTHIFKCKDKDNVKPMILIVFKSLPLKIQLQRGT